MKTIKVSEATGPALDWLVAKCEGGEIRTAYGVFLNQGDGFEYFTPCSDWVQGGPIIDRELTKVFRNVGGKWSAMILKEVPILPEDRGTSLALTHRAQWNGAGITPLIAAMRCYVASKLGDTAEVPEELL